MRWHIYVKHLFEMKMEDYRKVSKKIFSTSETNKYSMIIRSFILKSTKMTANEMESM